MYGNQIEASGYRLRRSVIGELTTAPAGNIILRVGRETGEGSGKWERTEHVVLTPDEARSFAIDVLLLCPRPEDAPTNEIESALRVVQDAKRSLGSAVPRIIDTHEALTKAAAWLLKIHPGNPTSPFAPERRS